GRKTLNYIQIESKCQSGASKKRTLLEGRSAIRRSRPLFCPFLRGLRSFAERRLKEVGTQPQPLPIEAEPASGEIESQAQEFGPASLASHPVMKARVVEPLLAFHPGWSHVCETVQHALRAIGVAD